MKSVVFTVPVQAVSKSNSPILTRFKGQAKASLIPSKKAQAFKRDCARLIPFLPEPFTCDVVVRAVLYYRDRRSDLDESLLLDCMQKRIYVNDRQVKEKHIWWRLHRRRPRCEVLLEPLEDFDGQKQISLQETPGFEAEASLRH